MCHISQRCESRNQKQMCRKPAENGHISQRCESRNSALTQATYCVQCHISQRCESRNSVGGCKGADKVVTSRRDVRVEIQVGVMWESSQVGHISQRCESRNSKIGGWFSTSISHISQRCESRNTIFLLFIFSVNVTSRRDVRVEIP